MIVLEHYATPETGLFELNVVVDVRVSANEAQKTVSRWVLDHVSYMMGAEPPTFVIGEKIVWRVPVILTATHVGRVGKVGSVDVDVMTGEILGDQEQMKHKMWSCAQELRKNLPPYRRQILPKEFIPAPNEQVELAQLPLE